MAAPVRAHIVRPLCVGNLLQPRITVEISAASQTLINFVFDILMIE